MINITKYLKYIPLMMIMFLILAMNLMKRIKYIFHYRMLFQMRWGIKAKKGVIFNSIPILIVLIYKRMDLVSLILSVWIYQSYQMKLLNRVAMMIQQLFHRFHKYLLYWKIMKYISKMPVILDFFPENPYHLSQYLISMNNHQVTKLWNHYVIVIKLETKFVKEYRI